MLIRNLTVAFALLMLGTAPAQAQSLTVGDPAPPLSIADWIKGEPVDVKSEKDKNVYLIEFWATWCPPCIESIPHLTELQKKYEDDGLVVIAITDEPKRVVRKFVEKKGNKMGYTVACDKDMSTSKAYMMAAEQMGIPTAFLITREGRIAFIGSPFFGIDEALEQVIKGTFDMETAIADAEFVKKDQMTLLMAMQNADWEKTLKLSRKLADPNNKFSRELRMMVLNAVSWAMATDERADPKYLKESLYLAKAAYDLCGCNDPNIIDTYARILFENGRTNEAIEYQKQAVAAADGMMKRELEAALREYQSAAKDGSKTN